MWLFMYKSLHWFKLYLCIYRVFSWISKWNIFYFYFETSFKIITAVIYYYDIVVVMILGGGTCSPLLQYCSSRLVLSYRLPHEATLSDILPFPWFIPDLSPLCRVLCPPSTPLSLFFTPSPLPIPPTFMDGPLTPTPAPASFCSPPPVSLSPTSWSLCGITKFRFVFSN